MWQAIIAAAAGMAYSSIQSALQKREAQDRLDEQKKQIDKTQHENDDLLAFAQNRDYTQTAGFQRANTQMRKLMQENTEAVEGKNAVMGGTRADEAVAKKQANDTVAQMVSKAVAEGEKTADNARLQRVKNNQWAENAKEGISSQEANLDIINAQQNAQAGTQIAKTFGSMLDSGVSSSFNSPSSNNSYSQYLSGNNYTQAWMNNSNAKIGMDNPTETTSGNNYWDINTSYMQNLWG